jgi:hypothetical protein
MATELLTDLKPDLARVVDYLLGGTDSYASDRDLAERVKAAYGRPPDGQMCAPAERAARVRLFDTRAANWLGHEGVRQVICLTPSLPCRYEPEGCPPLVPVHAAAPRSRVAYVLADPLSVPAAKLMTATAGHVTVACADPADPDAVLGNTDVRNLIDVARPFLLLTGPLVQYMCADRAREVIGGYAARLPAGSWLALCSVLHREMPDGLTGVAFETGYRDHARETVLSFFAGLDVMPPGISPVRGWGPEPLEPEGPAVVLAGMAKRTAPGRCSFRVTGSLPSLASHTTRASLMT